MSVVGVVALFLASFPLLSQHEHAQHRRHIERHRVQHHRRPLPVTGIPYGVSKAAVNYVSSMHRTGWVRHVRWDPAELTHAVLAVFPMCPPTVSVAEPDSCAELMLWRSGRWEMVHVLRFTFSSTSSGRQGHDIRGLSGWEAGCTCGRMHAGMGCALETPECMPDGARGFYIGAMNIRRVGVHGGRVVVWRSVANIIMLYASSSYVLPASLQSRDIKI